MEKIFNNKKEKYSNLCKLTHILLSLSSSNSSVERAFSLLNRCLRMNHDTLQDLMLINNSKLWTRQEKKDIENTCQNDKRQTSLQTTNQKSCLTSSNLAEDDSSESSNIGSSSEDTESNSETDKENNTDTDWLPTTLTSFC